MKSPRVERQIQKSSVVVTMLLFILVLVMLQLWLFVSVLEALIAGRTAMAVPGAAASALILAINVWMIRGVYRMEDME